MIDRSIEAGRWKEREMERKQDTEIGEERREARR